MCRWWIPLIRHAKRERRRPIGITHRNGSRCAKVARVDIAVIGLGLIGGSALRALAAHGHRVLGYDADPATRATARTAAARAPQGEPLAGRRHDPGRRRGRGAGGRRGAVAGAAEGARRDLRRAATPGWSPTSPRSRPRCATWSSSGCRGGTNAWRASSAATRWPARRAPGSRAADTELFQDCAWVLCLEPGSTSLTDWLDLAELVIGLGARVVPTTAEEHDRAVATISHVPHLLAAALAAAGARPARGRPGRGVVPRRHPRRGEPARADRGDVRWQRRGGRAGAGRRHRGVLAGRGRRSTRPTRSPRCRRGWRRATRCAPAGRRRWPRRSTCPPAPTRCCGSAGPAAGCGPSPRTGRR